MKPLLSTPVPEYLLSYDNCSLCPRMCGVNRHKSPGFCGCQDTLKAARAGLHLWEEPCISGSLKEAGGSGAVFFSGCTLGCRFCQNHQISREQFGTDLTVRQLADAFLRLQDQGALNINLVTPTQFLPSILPALDLVRHKLFIPVVCNCGGYERTETVRGLKDYVDIWLPDFKYYDNRLALKYSQAKDYFERASEAIAEMIAQTGPPLFSPEQPALMSSGVIIRHLVLPGHKEDSIALLQWMAEHLPENGYLLSLMSQYTPYVRDNLYPQLNRRITTYEYQKVVDTAISLGLTQGFMQEKSSAKEEYTPPFDLEGL